MGTRRTPKDPSSSRPATGSRHNSGCAVDLTLYDRATVSAGADGRRYGYDDFETAPTPPSSAEVGTAMAPRLLRSDGGAGSRVRRRMWHFDYRDWKEVPDWQHELRDRQAASREKDGALEPLVNSRRFSAPTISRPAVRLSGDGHLADNLCDARSPGDLHSQVVSQSRPSPVSGEPGTPTERHNYDAAGRVEMR